jgi:hypothetical protein
MVYGMAVVQEYRPLSHFDNNVKAALLAKTKNAKVFVPKMFFSGFLNRPFPAPNPRSALTCGTSPDGQCIKSAKKPNFHVRAP